MIEISQIKPPGGTRNCTRNIINASNINNVLNMGKAREEGQEGAT